MYKGYNLKLNRHKLDEYLESGESIFNYRSKKVRCILSDFINKSGRLDASKMTNSWFPDIEANVFISHSHQDRDLAVSLSGYLHYKFGIKSFIDSMVWGHSDKLLKMIDDEYCTNNRGKSYIYQKRNRSTSHVHMMLSVALSQMINRCECLFFVNTPKSINSSNVISSTTGSPWIYAEIAMTALIKRRSLDEHRGEGVLESHMTADSVPVDYHVDLGHLIDIDEEAFDNWTETVPREDSHHILRYDHYPKCYRALDHLYNTVK
ncbi:hypothetical protein [Novosphingobium pituita]|uniref:hypothetical protein n=1 Tax=Novosphingobium pituita TaxID=3056842 RepID=UPI00295ED0A9|nr:hypothetical protein [Novosphingobium sp. IK01]